MMPVPEKFKSVPNDHAGRVAYLLDLNCAAIQTSLPTGIDFSKRLVDKSAALLFAKGASIQQFDFKNYFGVPVEIRFYQRRGHSFHIVIADDQALIIEYSQQHHKNRLKAHRR